VSENRPTVDMNSSGFHPDNPEQAKTVMAGATGQSVTPHSLPRQPSAPPAWTPPPPPPSPSPFQPTPGPAAAGGKTVLMSAPAPQIPLAWLGVVSGSGAKRGTTFVLGAETVVGRAAGEALLGGDKTISSQHAKVRLEIKEGGAEDEHVFMLYDLASANGTYVGTRENYHEESSRVYRRELHNGDYILVGETTLVYLQA
jgi:hypothetical protein